MPTARDPASMTLHEYRLSLVLRLEACAGPVQAGTLLAEADLWFTLNRISDEGQADFWRAVTDDLCILAEQAALMHARELASILRAVLADGRRLRPKDGRPLWVRKGIPAEVDEGRFP
jgi:hypothetical protein